MRAAKVISEYETGSVMILDVSLAPPSIWRRSNYLCTLHERFVSSSNIDIYSTGVRHFRLVRKAIPTSCKRPVLILLPLFAGRAEQYL